MTAQFARRSPIYELLRHAMPDYYAGGNAERRVVARLTVMGEPKAKERPRAQPGGKGRSYTPKATRDAETIIQNAWDALTLPDYPTAGTFRIDVCCYLGTRRHVDGDNLLKLVKDALNGRAYDDDWMVHESHIRKFYTTRDRARTEIILSLIDPDREEQT